MKKLLTIVLFLGCTAFAQSPFVTITGNSIAHFQGPFASEEFPTLQSNQVYIFGADSEPCSYFNTLDGSGQPFIYFYIPAQTTVAVLIDSTNDIRTGVSTRDHMICIKQTITYLLARNPALKIIVADTPPWTQYNTCTDQNNDPSILTAIQAYNAAYFQPTTGLQGSFPNNYVRVADVYTPAALPNGWANTSLMNGPCGIHPGAEFVWSISWSHFSTTYDQMVMNAINGQ